MATPNLAEIPSDLLADFRLESSEQFQRCEQLLIELEHTPGDSERLRELFRLVHTLKGNLGYIGLDSLMKECRKVSTALGPLASYNSRGRVMTERNVAACNRLGDQSRADQELAAK